MDQLDILKSKWQAQDASLPRYSSEKIKSLLHHKSSSIVKWLLFIAIGEFLFFSLLGVVAHAFNKDYDFIEIFGEGFYYGTSAFHYVVIFIFIYLFYKNYKNISADQPSRSLMKNILKTRKTMKYYIWYNLGYMMVVGMWGSTIALDNDPQTIALKEMLSENRGELLVDLMVMGIFFVTYAVMCVILYLFYLLIYGILLKKLKRNYYELKKIEI